MIKETGPTESITAAGAIEDVLVGTYLGWERLGCKCRHFRGLSQCPGLRQQVTLDEEVHISSLHVTYSDIYMSYKSVSLGQNNSWFAFRVWNMEHSHCSNCFLFSFHHHSFPFSLPLSFPSFFLLRGVRVWWVQPGQDHAEPAAQWVMHPKIQGGYFQVHLSSQDSKKSLL